jgi:hypothetical protein
VIQISSQTLFVVYHGLEEETVCDPVDRDIEDSSVAMSWGINLEDFL